MFGSSLELKTIEELSIVLYINHLHKPPGTQMAYGCQVYHRTVGKVGTEIGGVYLRHLIQEGKQETFADGLCRIEKMGECMLYMDEEILVFGIEEITNEMADEDDYLGQTL